MSEPDIRKVVSELEEMLRRGVDHIDCDASDIRILLSALSEAEAMIKAEMVQQMVQAAAQTPRDAEIERLNALIRELVAALKSIDSEMDDTDHNFATRMFRAGEIIDAALTRAKEAGYE